MTELTDDLSKRLRDFQNISSKYNINERRNKKLNSVLIHLKTGNEILKENDKKSTEQVKILQQICNEQVETITELHDLKKENEILTIENASLQNFVLSLKEKINTIEINNNEIIQGYILKHKSELDEREKQFNKRESELQEKIEGLQASFDLQISENNNEKQILKRNFDLQMKNATDKEKQLKNEILKLNTQISSNTAVLQKKILQLEQKLKTSEREKSMFNISQGNFISANNVLRSYSNDNPITRNNNENHTEVHTQNRNSITRNVSQNIENNTAKKFQFRKTNRSSSSNVEKRLLSESFNPFEMNKQINANNQSSKQNNNSSKQMNATNSPNRDVIYEIIEDNSEKSNNSLQEYKLEETKMSDKSVIDDKETGVKIVEKNEGNCTKHVSPYSKKRRLFNPKNMDYLNQSNN